MKQTGFILGFIVLLFSACAPRVQFTQTIKNQHQLKEAELKSIQFYTTGDIVLQRLEDSGSKKATNEGELVIRSGSSLEQVVIKAGTPGVVVQMLDETRISVRFEQGEGKTLIFGNTQANKGAYYLLPLEISGNSKVVKYAGKKYAISGTSAYVSLSFKMRKLNKYEKEQRVVKGVKL
jgi:hypothetical protein